MNYRQALAALTLLALAVPASAGPRGDDPDPDRQSRAQERLDRDTARAAEKADELTARIAEERIKIETRAAEEPVRAAEESAKLDAELAKQEAEAAEEAAKREQEYAEELAKEQDDAAEDAAKLAERGDDASSQGSSVLMHDLGESEGAEHDEDGFPVRRGELVAMDVPAAALRTAETRGFRVIDRQTLPTLARELVRLEAPRGMTAMAAREQMRALAPQAVVDLVHYYGLNFAAGAKPRPIKGSAAAPRTRAALVVGVIDTAIAPHRALGGAKVISWKAGVLPGAPIEHGTAVASIVAGHGTATIYSANIFRGPADRPFTSADTIAGALEWMLQRDIPTINLSLAGPRNAILDRLVRDALAQGRSVVAAAGNGGPTAPPAYPAAVPGVIAVTAVDQNLRVYRYANRGRYITVAARGVDVVAAHTRGGLARFTGTSFAAPHIAGWIAQCRAGGTAANVCRDRLRSAARDLGNAGFDDVYGFGYVQ